MLSAKKPTYKLFGERAVLIEWEAKISTKILADITSFKNTIQHQLKNRIENCVVGYHSLAVIYKDIINFSLEKNTLQKLYTKKITVNRNTLFLWEIPVCYDVTFGVDLESIAKQLQLSLDEIILLHTQTIYTVYFIGFLPGFLYLGGLDSRLSFDRKPNPRFKVAKGAVAIGGHQTGVYPQESAGGWNVIGNTPISFFNIEKQPPCFAQYGDTIRFFAIDLKEYKHIQQQIIQGTYQLSKTKMDD